MSWTAVYNQWDPHNPCGYKLALSNAIHAFVGRSPNAGYWQITVMSESLGELRDLETAKAVAIGAMRALLQKALRDLDNIQPAD